MKIGGIKKLGRVHNCCGGCSVISECLTEENFLKIFSVTGNYSVESEEGYWTSLDAINDNDSYHSGHDDTIVFSGSCTLELISDKAMYANDNFGMQLGVNVALSGSQSEVCAETLTFTLGSRVLVNTFTLDVSTGERTLEITLDNNTVYRYIPGDDARIDLSYSTSFVENREFYLIRRDNAIDYYISVPNIGAMLICEISGASNYPVEMEYSYGTSQSGTTVSFAPGCFSLWKPDRWWNTLQFAPYVKQTLQDNSNFNNSLNVLCTDAFENEGCKSPYSIGNSYAGGGLRNILNDSLYFQALSPSIRVSLSGFKSFSGQTSPKDDAFVGYWWTIDKSTPSGSTIHHEDLTVDDIPGLRAALDAGTANINSYLEAYAQTLESEGKCYSFVWQNGGTATLNYLGLTSQPLPGIYGQEKIKLRESNPATVLTAYECYYPDTELPYFPYVQTHNANELHGEWVYNYYIEDWEYNKWGYAQGTTFTVPVRAFPDGRSVPSAEDQCYVGGEITLHYGIVAFPVAEKIPRNGMLTLSFQDTFNITRNNGINKTSKLQYGHQVTSLQVTKNPAHGSCTVFNSYYPYKITYTANASSGDLVDSFEYELTDQFGTKSKNIVIIEFDDNTTANKTVENTCNNGDPAISDVDLDDWRGAGYDYWIIVRVYLTIVGMGSVELFAPLNKKCLSVIGETGFTAQYIKALDIETDENDNPIRQIYSLDGRAQDELSATVSFGSDNALVHQNNFAMADEYVQSGSKNVAYIVANVTAYYKTGSSGVPEDDYTELENIQCILNPPHDYTAGREIGVLGRGSAIFYYGSFEYSFTADGSERTSIVYLSLTSQLNNTLPYCIDYAKDILVDGTSYNYKGGYKINSFVIYYEDGTTATISNW